MQVPSRRAARSFSSAALSLLLLWTACAEDGEAGRTGPEPATALAIGAPPKIESVTMEGPGCPDGALSAIGISGVRDTFRIQFEAFAVSARGAPATPESSCTVSVTLDGAEGVAYAPAGMTLVASTAYGASLSTSGSWTGALERTSEDVAHLPGGGTYLTSALNDPQLWSPCSGPRTLRFTLRLSLDGKRGSAEVERLSNLRFVSRACTDADAAADAGELAMDAGLLAPADAARDAAQPATEADAGSGVTPTAPEPSVQVADVLSAGSLCPAASATVTVTDPRDSVAVDFSTFSLAASAERPLGTGDCSVNLQVDVPEGRTIAIEHFTLRGSASLPEGATARLTAYYSYVGVPRSSASKVVPLAGPFEGPFVLTADFAGDDLLFRNCEEPRRRLNIRLSLSIRAGEAGAPARASLAHLGDVRFVSRSCE